MTFEQMKFAMEQIRKFINQKKDTCYEAMHSLLDKTRFYFTEIDFQNLFLHTYKKSENNLTKEDFVSDCNTIIFTLEGMLAKDKNYHTVKSILKDIDKFSKCKSDKSIREAVKSIYHTYSDRIKFNKVIEKLISEDATNDHLISIGFDGFDKTLLDSMIKNLKNYANEICLEKPKKETIRQTKTDTTININNNNILNAKIDIDVAIENAIEQLENACLSDEQEKQVKEKISELEDIVKSKINQKSKWQKLGEIMKWVVEQGVQVASIIVPLIANAIK